MTVDFGTDLALQDDVSPEFPEVAGIDTLIDACVRRLSTPQGDLSLGCLPALPHASLSISMGARKHAALCRRGKGQRCNWTQKQISQVVREYLAGAPSTDLAKKYRTTTDTILSTVRRSGAKVRSFADANRRYVLDETFFDHVNTEAKAYWLGFIMADGCVHLGNRIQITLAAKDIDHVRKFAHALSSNKPVRITDHGTGATICIVSQHMTDSLARYGITPRKSFTAKPPSLPRRLIRHFWRGVFDGDGCIYLNTKGSWHACLVGSKQTIAAFARFAKEVCGTDAKPHASRSIFGLNVGGNGKAILLLRKLYGRSSVYLERKYESYLSACGSAAKPRKARLLTYRGETKRAAYWADQIGMSRHGFLKRLSLGWSAKEAIETPVLVKFRSSKRSAA